MRILFYDVTAPFPYSLAVSKERALGGTEGTVIRIAHALAKTHLIYIAQHCHSQKDEHEEEGVHYISLKTAHELSADAVILLREHQQLEETALRYNRSKLFFWMHNFPSKNFFQTKKHLLQYPKKLS